MVVLIADYVSKIGSTRSSCIQCKDQLVFDNESKEHEYNLAFKWRLHRTKLSNNFIYFSKFQYLTFSITQNTSRGKKTHVKTRRCGQLNFQYKFV